MPKVSVACMCPCGVHSTKPVSHSRLITRFRTGCHGLQVDAGRWADSVPLDRTDRLCRMRKSFHCVEDQQHFVFDCLGPAYSCSHIRSQHWDLLQHCCTIADFMTVCELNTCGGFLRECFHIGSKSCLYELTELTSCLLRPSCPPGH